MLRSRWFWIAAAAVVLGFIVYHHDGAGTSRSTSCWMQVVVDGLNVRADPDARAAIVDKLHAGQVTPAGVATENGFRQLAEGHWAAEAFLRPAAGTCH